MRIVGVIDEDPFDQATWSGSSHYFFSALKARNVLVDAFAATPSPAVQYFHKAMSFQPGLKAWKFKYSLNLSYYAQMSRCAHKLLSQIPSNDYDAVLQIGAWYDMTDLKGKLVASYHDGSLATLLKSPYGYPKISASYIKKTLEYEKSLYRRMGLIFPMSEWLADSFMKDNDVHPSKLHPVGAGINLPKVRPIENKSYEEPRILFVGKDFERKGGKTLLEAFAKVKREIRQATLTVVGPNLDNAPDGVNAIGTLSKSNPDDLERLLDEYQRASLFVMPSLYEPFGIVFAEAMAHRLPCVGTSICAIPEIIDDGRTGYLVEPGNPDDLAMRLLDLLKNPAMCMEMGNAGYEKYRNKYTWKSVTDRICIAMESKLQA